MSSRRKILLRGSYTLRQLETLKATHTHSQANSDNSNTEVDYKHIHAKTMRFKHNLHNSMEETKRNKWMVKKHMTTYFFLGSNSTLTSGPNSKHFVF